MENPKQTWMMTGGTHMTQETPYGDIYSPCTGYQWDDIAILWERTIFGDTTGPYYFGICMGYNGMYITDNMMYIHTWVCLKMGQQPQIGNFKRDNY